MEGRPVEFRVLGTVECSTDGVSVDIGRRRVERGLLGLLLVDLGRPVRVARLVELLWEDRAPDNPRRAIQVAVSRLRRVLAAADAERHGFKLITLGDAYTLEGDPERVDLHRFRIQVDRARRAVDPVEQQTMIGDALALVRGPLLSDVGGNAIADWVRPGFDEEVLGATELRIHADLTLGRHAEVVAELTTLMAAHPLRERVVCLRMLALHRCGRLPEALAVAREFRETLADEHGLDPSPEFVELANRLLAEDPGLLTVSPRSTPAQLPPDTADFTARGGEVARLTAALTGPQSGPPVWVISGQGGVGKSTLAIHVAHAVADAYPDGHLYVDLRGATDTPAAPSEVMARFLRAMGLPTPELPSEREDLLRSALSAKRMLIVLDDAAGEHQVHPLLPGTSTCGVLVTSRRLLPALRGAAYLELGTFDPEVAIELLGRIIGADRVDAEPRAARALVELCGGLPLAVRNTGARTRSRGHWPLESMVRRLADEHRRLDELDMGDVAVRASVGLSYHALDPVARRTFRLLGLLGVPDFAAWVAAALLDVPEEAAEEIVERLVEARVVDIATPGPDREIRYRLHDLHRIYAAERAGVEELDSDRADAVSRAMGAWLWLVQTLSDRTPSGEIEPCATYTTAYPLTMAPADAHAWFQTELPSLVVAVERASAMDLHVAACEVAAALCCSSLAVGNRFDQWWRTHAAAVGAAMRADDHVGAAMTLVGLGQLRYAQDEFDDAIEYYDQAMDHYAASGDVRGRGVVLAGIGSAFREQGRLLNAREVLTDACVAFTIVDDTAGLGYSSRLAASVDLELGDYIRAVSAVEQSLAAYRRLGSRRGEALALRTSGLIQRAMGNYPAAHALCAEALDMLTGLGDQLMIAYASQALVKTQIRLGVATMGPLHDALATCRSHHDRLGEGLVLRTMGELELAAGRPAEAETLLWEAIAVWDSVDLPVFRARAMRDLAAAHAATARPESAIGLRQEALRIFAEHGTREWAELSDQHTIGIGGDPATG
ncbi:MAG TPA: BTAD domain-containing putative transcriptional regulator [Actinokineospora sp.]|nr:BTAD domain-containing putative transcriptional regulator [Actinokineospora sp.]